MHSEASKPQTQDHSSAKILLQQAEVPNPLLPVAMHAFRSLCHLKTANYDVQGLYSKGHSFPTILFSSQKSLLGTYQAAPLLA